MTVNITKWQPDTCQCEVEYSWDSILPADQRVHTLSSIIKCPIHSSLSDTEAYTTVTEENPRKNITLQFCLENGPSALFDTNTDGARILKPNLTFNFSWSGTAPNRVLTISFTGISLTNQQKNTIRSVLNTRFGSGKVVIA